MLDRGEQEGGPAGRGSALETWPEEPGRPAWEEESVVGPVTVAEGQRSGSPSLILLPSGRSSLSSP